ncbi:MAG: SDR family NAD(P)-dependent oxidoreductase [Phycisphaeraceae bacterium]|nr:SDR family NAD(P)-dependent oxidoreductase [Phycisphaeraceae bacterium]
MAVVTGASSGIGRATALRLGRRGYHLVLVARRRAMLEELAGQIADGEGATAGCTIMEADLSDRENVGSVAGELARLPGLIEVLVNNAGHGIYSPMLEVRPDEERALMQVHYHAAAALIRAVLPGMLDRGRGHVINVGSISVKMAPWGHAPYTAAKAALVAMTQSLAAEHPPAESGVHISYVNPGIVRTEFFEKPGMRALFRQVTRHGITADAVAGRIERLLDRPRLEVCVPRYYRVMDWISAISPGLAHRIVARQSRPKRR